MVFHKTSTRPSQLKFLPYPFITRTTVYHVISMERFLSHKYTWMMSITFLQCVFSGLSSRVVSLGNLWWCSDRTSNGPPRSPYLDPHLFDKMRFRCEEGLNFSPRLRFQEAAVRLETRTYLEAELSHALLYSFPAPTCYDTGFDKMPGIQRYPRLAGPLL